MKFKTYIRHWHLDVVLLAGFAIAFAGASWMLFGVPFEDPFWIWMQRIALFLMGLILIVASRKRLRKSTRHSRHSRR